MKKYRGYYIDGCVFRTEKEIDDFVKNQAVKKYSTLCAMFSRNPSMELNAIMCAHAYSLHHEHGLSYEQIEQIEISAIQ